MDLRLAMMEEDLTNVGFKALKNAADVEAQLKKPGKQLLVINSVCGCAAGNARPGVKQAIQDVHLITVFAGVDKEATEKIREYIPYPPSSPSFAVLEDGKCVHFYPRENIEGNSVENIAADVKSML